MAEDVEAAAASPLVMYRAPARTVTRLRSFYEDESSSEDDDDDDNKQERKMTRKDRANLARLSSPYMSRLPMSSCPEPTTPFADWFADYQDPVDLLRQYPPSQWQTVDAGEIRQYYKVSATDPLLHVAVEERVRSIVDGTIEFKFKNDPQIREEHRRVMHDTWTCIARDYVRCEMECGFGLFGFDEDADIIGVPVMLDLRMFEIRVLVTATNRTYYICRPLDNTRSTGAGITDYAVGITRSDLYGSGDKTDSGWLEGVMGFGPSHTTPDKYTGQLRSKCKMAMTGLAEINERKRLIHYAEARAVIPSIYTVDTSHAPNDGVIPSENILERKVAAQRSELELLTAATAMAENRVSPDAVRDLKSGLTRMSTPSRADQADANALSRTVALANLKTSSVTNITPGRSLVFAPAQYIPPSDPVADEARRELIARIFELPVQSFKLGGSTAPLVAEASTDMHHGRMRRLKNELVDAFIRPLFHAIHDDARLAVAISKLRLLRQKIGTKDLPTDRVAVKSWARDMIEVHIKMPNMPSYPMMKELVTMGALKIQAFAKFMTSNYSIEADDLNSDEFEPPQIEYIEPEPPAIGGGGASGPRKRKSSTAAPKKKKKAPKKKEADNAPGSREKARAKREGAKQKKKASSTGPKES
jgi:hypothetical protein